jgi:AraC family transcriptional regulator
MNTAPDSRAEYARRIHRVLAHIDQHIDQPLELTELAQVAHFSPYHFHRLFAAWVGETLGDYLRRRRVELAAMRLLAQPRLGVLPAALAVGFGSGEAFSRAFKARFGAAPSSWRAQQLARRRAPAPEKSNPGQAQRKDGQALRLEPGHHLVMHHPPENSMTQLNVLLQDRAPAQLAYFRLTGGYGAALGEFWRDTVAPWMGANGLMDKPRYGISHDDPSITDPAKCRYDAAVEVPPNAVLSGQPLRTTLPGGRYATLPFYGTSEQVAAAWVSLLGEWLPASGLQLDNRPCFEYYPPDGRYDPQTGAFSCEICIPVTAL